MLQAHRQERRPAIRDSVVRKVNAHLESGQRPKNKSKTRRKARAKWVRVRCGRLLSPTYGVFFYCLMIKLYQASGTPSILQDSEKHQPPA